MESIKHFSILITNESVPQLLITGARARLKELTPFHFSPRYFGREEELIQEAMTAFRLAPN